MIRNLFLIVILLLAPADAAAQATSEGLQDAPTPANSCRADAANNALAVSLDGQPSKYCNDNAGKSAARALLAPSTRGTGTVATSSWQAALVTGLGEVLADRAKAEVQAWFEDLVREELCKLRSPGKNGPILWLPETCKLLRDDRGAGQQLASSMVSDAIRADLQQLSSKVALYLKARAPSAGAAVATISAVAIIAAVATAADSLTGRRNPLLWLRDLSANDLVIQACKSRKVRSQLTPACALVFAGTAVDHYGWVVNQERLAGRLDGEAIKEVVKDVFAAEKFRCEVIKRMTSQSCATLAAGTAPSWPSLVEQFFQVADGSNEENFTRLLAVFQDMVDINDLVAKLDGPSDLARAKELLAKVGALLDHLERLLGAAPHPHLQGLRYFVQASASIANRDYAAAARSLVDGLGRFGVSLPKWAKRFLPLIVDLAEAKSSGEVSAALERAIAPVGSWRLKRQEFVLSVTSLVGVAAGWEAPSYGKAQGVSLEGGLAAGLMAPVGLHATWPVGSWSLGGFASVLDVGQITWTRVFEQSKSTSEAGAEQSPEADFAKVFSPGLFFTAGIGDTPFTFGAGVSFAPALRSYTYELDGTERSRDVSVWRFGLFFAADVTLLPF